ncbi:TPA: HAD-IA family hydrolase [Serratia marcescens]|nr:HAD-IA family hydrolase [Serratia marcescens]
MTKHIPVIFDLDGTLVDTLPDIRASLDMAVKSLEVDAAQNFPVSKFVGGGVDAMIAAASRFYGIEDIEKLNAAYREIYETNCALESCLYPGIRKLLESLKKSGAKLAILTNKEEFLARRIAEKLFATETFDIIYGATPGRKLKPSTEGIDWIFNEFGVDASAACYIGDTCIDMKTGRDSGAHVFAVTWGYGDLRDLEPSASERTCNSTIELLSCLESLNRKINRH